jgi:hypothetical protein
LKSLLNDDMHLDVGKRERTTCPNYMLFTEQLKQNINLGYCKCYLISMMHWSASVQNLHNHTMCKNVRYIYHQCEYSVADPGSSVFFTPP